MTNKKRLQERTVALKERAISLRNQGLTFLQISLEMSIAYSTVQRYLGRRKSRSRNYTKPEQEAQRALAAGMTQKPCLTCQNIFWSEGKHNKICAPCKGSSAFNGAMI